MSKPKSPKNKKPKNDEIKEIDGVLVNINTGEIVEKLAEEVSSVIDDIVTEGVSSLKKKTRAKEKERANAIRSEFEKALAPGDKILKDLLTQKVKTMFKGLDVDTKAAFGDYESAEVSSSINKHVNKMVKMIEDSIIYGIGVDKNDLANKVEELNVDFSSALLEKLAIKMREGKVYSGPTEEKEIDEFNIIVDSAKMKIQELSQEFKDTGEFSGNIKKLMLSLEDTLSGQYSADVIFREFNDLQKRYAESLEGQNGINDTMELVVESFKAFSSGVDPEEVGKVMKDITDNTIKPIKKLQDFDLSKYKNLMLGIGAGITGLVAEIYAAEKEIYAIAAITDMQGAEVSKFRTEMSALAVTLPFTTRELASSYGDLVRTGKSAAEASVILRSVGDLAIATFEPLGKVTTNVNALVLAMELSADKTTAVTKTLFNVLNTTPLGFESLAAALTQTGAAFNSVIGQTSKTGEELEDYKMELTKLQSSLIGGMSLLGKTGSQAGTAIRNMTTRLQSMEAAAKSAVDADLIRAGGFVSSTGIVIKTAQDLSELASEDFMKVTQVLSEMSKTGVLSFDAMRKLFTGRNVTQIAGVLAQVDGNVEEFNRRMSEMGDLSKAAEIAGQSWVQQYKQLAETFGDFKNVLGDFADVFSGAMSLVNGAVSSFAKVISESPMAKGTALGITSSIASMGTLITLTHSHTAVLKLLNKYYSNNIDTGMKLTQVILKMGGAFMQFLMNNKWMLAVSAIVGLATAMNELRKNAEAVRNETRKTVMTYENQIETYKLTNEASKKMLKTSEENISRMTSIFEKNDMGSQFENIFYGFDDGRAAINRLNTALKEFIVVAQKSRESLRGDKSSSDRLKEETAAAAMEYGYDTEAHKKAKERRSTFEKAQQFVSQATESGIDMELLKTIARGDRTVDESKKIDKELAMKNVKTSLREQGLSYDGINIDEMFSRLIEDNINPDDFEKELAKTVGADISNDKLIKALDNTYKMYHANVNGLVDSYDTLSKEMKSKFSGYFGPSKTKMLEALNVFFQEDQKTQTDRMQAQKEELESKIRLNSQIDQMLKSSNERIRTETIKAYGVESKSGAELEDALARLSEDFPDYALPFQEAIDAMRSSGFVKSDEIITKEKLANFRQAQALYAERVSALVTNATKGLTTLAKDAVFPSSVIAKDIEFTKDNVRNAIMDMFGPDNGIAGKVSETTERQMLIMRDSFLRQIDEEVNKKGVKASEVPNILSNMYNKFMQSMQDKMISDFKYLSKTSLGSIEEAMLGDDMIFSKIPEGDQLNDTLGRAIKTYWSENEDQKEKMVKALTNIRSGKAKTFDKDIADLTSLRDIAKTSGESEVTATLTAIIDKYNATGQTKKIASGIGGMKGFKPGVLSTYEEEYILSVNELVDSISTGNDELSKYLNTESRKLIDAKKSINSAFSSLSGKELSAEKLDELESKFSRMSSAKTSKEVISVAKELISNADAYGLDKSNVESLKATIFSLGDNSTRILNLISSQFSEIDGAVMSSIKSLGGIENYSFLDSTLDKFEGLMKELASQGVDIPTEMIEERIAELKAKKNKEIELESIRYGIGEAIGANNYQGAFNIQKGFGDVITKRTQEIKELEDTIAQGGLAEREKAKLENKRIALSMELTNLQVESITSEIEIQKALAMRVKELQDNFYTELESSISSAIKIDNKKLTTEDSFASMADSMSAWFVNNLRPDSDPNKMPGMDMKTLIKMTNSMLDYMRASKLEKAMDSIDKKMTAVTRAQKDLDRKARLADDVQEKAALFNEQQVLAEELTRLEIEKMNIDQLSIAQIQTDQLYNIIHELQILQQVSKGEKTQGDKNKAFGESILGSFKDSFGDFSFDNLGDSFSKMFSGDNMANMGTAGMEALKGMAGNLANQVATDVFTKWTGDAALGQTLGGVTQAFGSILTGNPMDIISGGLSAIQGISKGLFGDKKAEKEISKKIEEHNEKIKDAVADFNFEMLVSKLESINSGIRQVSDNITKYGLRGAYNMYMSQSGASMTGAGAAEYVSHTERYGGSWVRRRRRKDVYAAVTETMDLKRIGDILGGNYKEALGDYRLNSSEEMNLALQGAKKIQEGLNQWRGANTGAQHAKGDYGKQWAQSSAMLDATSQMIEKLEGVQKLYSNNLDKFNSQLFGFTVEFIDEFGNVADSSEEIVDVIITEWDKLAGILDSVANNIFQETSAIGDAVYSAIFDSAAQALSKSDEMMKLGDELAKLVYDFSKTFIPEDMDTAGANANLNQMDILEKVLGVMDKMKEEEQRLKDTAAALAEGMLALGGDIKELRPYLSIDFQTMETQVSHYQEKYTEAMQEIKTELYNAFKSGKGPIAITEANMAEYNKALSDYIASQQAAKDVTDYITDEFTNKFLSGEMNRPFEDVAEYLNEEVVEMRNTIADFFRSEDMNAAASNFGKTIGDKITNNIIDKMLDTQKYRNALNSIYKSVDAIIEKGASVSFAELSKIAQDAQKYSMMMDQERQKIQAMKDMFNFDSEVVYDTTNDTINYQTSSSKESVYNIYQTNNFDIGNFVSTRASMEEFSDMVAPYLARSFDNLGL
ncbi:MAG: phage tail tape measure protein [Bacteroidales bacterium]